MSSSPSIGPAKKLAASSATAAELEKKLKKAIADAAPPGEIPPPEAMLDINILAKAAWLKDKVEDGAELKDAVRELVGNMRRLEAARQEWVAKQVAKGVPEAEARARLEALTSGKASVKLVPSRDGSSFDPEIE